MNIGDRVRVQRHLGTIIEPDEALIATRDVLRTRPGEYWTVKFDGPGPYGDGYGVYHRSSYLLYKVPVKRA